jgi:hypothetical protein
VGAATFKVLDRVAAGSAAAATAAGAASTTAARVGLSMVSLVAVAIAGVGVAHGLRVPFFPQNLQIMGWLGEEELLVLWSRGRGEAV